MYGAHYATADFLKLNNNIRGGSFVCPAVPKEEENFLIEKIKNGSLSYIYHQNRSYHKTSRILNNTRFISSIRRIRVSPQLFNF